MRCAWGSFVSIRDALCFRLVDSGGSCLRSPYKPHFVPVAGNPFRSNRPHLRFASSPVSRSYFRPASRIGDLSRPPTKPHPPTWPSWRELIQGENTFIGFSLLYLGGRSGMFGTHPKRPTSLAFVARAHSGREHLHWVLAFVFRCWIGSGNAFRAIRSLVRGFSIWSVTPE